MTFVDPIGDMITRIRNAQMRMLNNVRIPGSKFREKILDVLKQEGYIADYKLLSDSNNKGSLSVDLKDNTGGFNCGKPSGYIKDFKALPQNINFAIKGSYVSNLISILPEYQELSNRKNLLLGKSLEEKIELVSPFIVTIK